MTATTHEAIMYNPDTPEGQEYWRHRREIEERREAIIAHELLSPDDKQAWYEHIEHLAMLYAQILRETDRESPRAVYLSADAHEGLARCRLLMASPIFA
jgi:hypothetical protein